MPNLLEDVSLEQIFRVPGILSIVEIVLIILLSWLAIFATQRALPWLANRLHGRRRLFVLTMVPILRLLFIVVAFAMIVPIVIKPSLQNTVVLLGAAGLAIGFALKDLVSSLVAGVVAVGEMPYRNGDWITIDGAYGEVRHVGMRVVKIVTPDDTVVSIPHARLWTEPVFNSNDGNPRLMCVAEFYLHPRHDAARVKQILEDVALTSAFLHLRQPVTVIAQEKPWGTQYRLKAYPVDSRQQFAFVTDMTVRGKAALTELGVGFSIAPALAQA